MRIVSSTRIATRAALMAFVLALPVAAFGQTVVPGTVLASPPRIVVTGTGEARVTPDRATILIGVQSRATTAAAAASDNARRQRAVTDTLRAIGVQSDQISTMNYNVSPEMQYPPNGQPKLTGYTVTNTVRVDVRKLDDIGRFIDASLAKGANNIAGLQFFSSKADSVRRAALATAITNARADAEAMARAAGGSLGQLLELSTEAAPRPIFEAPMARMAAAGPAPTQIDPGVQTVTVTVAAQWAFTSR